MHFDGTWGFLIKFIPYGIVLSGMDQQKMIQDIQGTLHAISPNVSLSCHSLEGMHVMVFLSYFKVKADIHMVTFDGQAIKHSDRVLQLIIFFH
uniref:Uncharacterized protein n=1 Tax=Arion vulgaris TaxID=1028688 RepID=A0A0B7AID7_9EUPU